MRAFALASASALLLTVLVCLVSGDGVSVDQAPNPLWIVALSLVLFVVAALRRPRPVNARRSAGVMAVPVLEESWGQK